MASRYGISKAGISEANITPLADVTTTLIVVFLVTLPTLLWSGIEVQSKVASQGSQQVVQPSSTKKVGLLTVAVKPEGITLNQERIEMEDLEAELSRRLAAREDRTVVIVPDDRVRLGEVVSVLDIAKVSGATDLALLNLKQRAESSQAVGEGDAR
jgi:biopolymer transport protein ExbD